MDKRRGGGGQKMSVFVHAQGIKTVHAGGGVKKWQNSVHVVVECPLMFRPCTFEEAFFSIVVQIPNAIKIGLYTR